MKAPLPTPARRTQQERRETTVRKLLDAATEALIEVGYSNTSVQEMPASAPGFSHGGLFRHFSSRIELLIRVADDVGNNLLEIYRGDFERLRQSGTDELVLALRLLRAILQSHLHQAWFELLMAARTDRVLHEALLPIWKRRYEAASAVLRWRCCRKPLAATAAGLPHPGGYHGHAVSRSEAVDRFLRDEPRDSEKAAHGVAC